jgi:hypothetical protein
VPYDESGQQNKKISSFLIPVKSLIAYTNSPISVTPREIVSEPAVVRTLTIQCMGALLFGGILGSALSGGIAVSGS